MDKTLLFEVLGSIVVWCGSCLLFFHCTGGKVWEANMEKTGGGCRRQSGGQ